MSVVLGALFIVALLITLIGLVLSPRTQTRRQPDRPVLTARGRSAVATTSIPSRAHRTTSVDRLSPVRPRASALTAPAGRNTQTTLRASERRVPAAGPGQARYPAGRAGGADLALDAQPWESLKDRPDLWRIALPGLIAIFLLGFYLLHMVLPYPLLWMPVTFGSASLPSASTSGSAPVYAASQHLSRLSQLDPAQYRSTQEFNLWAYSACSAASMTEVMNAYNHTYKITDVLEIEAAIHEITPDLGLLEEVGIQRTGARFGFTTTWGHNLSLDQVIAAANHGTPVIVSFPPARYPGGHILVVRGGDSAHVYLADSSRLNWTQVTRDRFMQLWAGFSAIMIPAHS